MDFTTSRGSLAGPAKIDRVTGDTTLQHFTYNKWITVVIIFRWNFVFYHNLTTLKLGNGCFENDANLNAHEYNFHNSHKGYDCQSFRPPSERNDTVSNHFQTYLNNHLREGLKWVWERLEVCELSYWMWNLVEVIWL